MLAVKRLKISDDDVRKTEWLKHIGQHKSCDQHSQWIGAQPYLDHALSLFLITTTL